MNEKILAGLKGNTEKYPHDLEKNFPRVFAKIVELWDSPALDHYLEELMMDTRDGARQGFPATAAKEIFNLTMRDLGSVAPVASAWDKLDEPQKQALAAQGFPFTPGGFLKAAESGNKHAIQIFLGSGVEVDIRDDRDWTPLMVSAFNGHEEAALLLLQCGAKVDVRDKQGYGPLHWAAFNGYDKVVKLLLQKKADPNAQSDFGWTPLLQAATRGHLIAAALLIAGRANVNLATLDGWTALHKASINGNVDLVRLLLSKGASPYAQAQDGSTALSLARKAKHAEIAEMLLAATQARH